MIYQVYKLTDLIQAEWQRNEKLQEGLLRAHWEEWMEKYAKYSEILSFVNGILSIKVKNSMALQHMYMNKNNIMAQLNEKLQEKEFQVLDMKWILEGNYE